MLCILAVHLNREGGCTLRGSGSTSLGPSGSGGHDAKHYPTAEALFHDLDSLGLQPEAIQAAARQLESPEARKRFLKFASDVQIAFGVLERVGIDLFD